MDIDLTKLDETINKLKRIKDTQYEINKLTREYLDLLEQCNDFRPREYRVAPPQEYKITPLPYNPNQTAPVTPPDWFKHIEVRC